MYNWLHATILGGKYFYKLYFRIYNVEVASCHSTSGKNIFVSYTLEYINVYLASCHNIRGKIFL